MRTAAILPVKRFVRAKQRLGSSVAEIVRMELAQAMVGDVLEALLDTPAIDLTIVVTREPQVADSARELGALVVTDVAEDGQSAAVSLGARRALAEGMERALCVPGDCPALDPSELGELLTERENGGDPSVTIIPDRHGTGTNGLLLTPADAIGPSFGANSFERHAARARDAGVKCFVRRPGSLLLDIDTGSDLAALRERLAELDATTGTDGGGVTGRASRTRVVLERAERAKETTLSPGRA
ncbi:MAG TPA: 2-phospho-L-lactate guanylyltransferase [Solirubrobacteraceae bacterium]